MKLAVDRAAGYAHATLLRFAITDDKIELRTPQISAVNLYATLKNKAPILVRKLEIVGYDASDAVKVYGKRAENSRESETPVRKWQRKTKFAAETFFEAHGHYEAQVLHNEALFVSWRSSKLICCVWLLVHNVEALEIVNDPLKYTATTKAKSRNESAATRRQSHDSNSTSTTDTRASEKPVVDPYAFELGKDVVDFTFNFSLFGSDDDSTGRIYTYTFLDVFTKKDLVTPDYVQFVLIKAERAELQQATEQQIFFSPKVESLAFTMKFPHLCFYSLTILNCRKLPVCRIGGPVLFESESSEFRSANFDTLGDDFLRAAIDCGDAKIDIHLGTETSRNQRNRRYTINRLIIHLSTALLFEFGI